MQSETESLRTSIESLRKKEKEREALQQNLLLEPEDSEDFIMVSVMHIVLGKIQRKFPLNCQLRHVYDWIGSLDYVNFYLSLPMQLNSPLPKAESIDICKGTLLRMIETNEEVAEHELTSWTSSIKKIEERREMLADHLVPIPRKLIVRRDFVFEDIVNFFSDKEVFDYRFEVSFDGENAEGDGVGREAFDIFINELLLKNFDGREQYLPVMMADVTEDDYEHIGSIIFHFFLNFGVFPFQIARASLTHALGKPVKNQLLMESFLLSVSKKDATFLSNAYSGAFFDKAAAIESLSVYGIRRLPTVENIEELILKSAKMHVINKPAFAMLHIVKGFKNFFSDLPENCIEAMYGNALPTPNTVMQAISFPDPKDDAEERAFEYFKRLIDEADQPLLIKLLQFTTSSSYLLPGAKMTVSCKSMSEFVSRPTSFTCFKKIYIPKNFSTYLAFQNNVIRHLYQPEYKMGDYFE